MAAPGPLDAQQAPAPAADPNAQIGVTPLVAPSQQFAAPPPDLTPQGALIGENLPPIKTQATLCVRPVVADDGEVRTWTKLEQLDAVQVGWNAYLEGDYTRAEPFFDRLAKIGHPEAERLMGIVYYQGQGVPQDYARALYWFEKSSDLGCWTSYAATATMYRDGKGTGIDLGKAYMWFNIAAAGLPDSVERDALIKEREDVAAQMTEAQIEAAQKRSRAFAAKQVNPPDPEDLPVDYFPTKTN